MSSRCNIPHNVPGTWCIVPDIQCPRYQVPRSPEQIWMHAGLCTRWQYSGATGPGHRAWSSWSCWSPSWRWSRAIPTPLHTIHAIEPGPVAGWRSRTLIPPGRNLARYRTQLCTPCYTILYNTTPCYTIHHTTLRALGTTTQHNTTRVVIENF